MHSNLREALEEARNCFDAPYQFRDREHLYPHKAALYACGSRFTIFEAINHREEFSRGFGAPIKNHQKN